MLNVVWLQLVSVERSITLHCISESSSVHVFSTAGVLWLTKLMERWQFLDLQLVVVRERNRRSIAGLDLAVGWVAMMVDVVEHVTSLIKTVALSCFQIVVHCIAYCAGAPLLSCRLAVSKSSADMAFVAENHIPHVLGH